DDWRIAKVDHKPISTETANSLAIAIAFIQSIISQGIINSRVLVYRFCSRLYFFYMEHETSLIGTIVVVIGVAFLIGALAHRLRISPIAGYLLAGVIVGPFTPGFVADTGLALQLAEIGVILLMFGVGL